MSQYKGDEQIQGISGWFEEGQEKPKTNIPTVCPKCGKKLGYTNALQSCNWYFVYCPNLKCRWARIYYE